MNKKLDGENAFSDNVLETVAGGSMGQSVENTYTMSHGSVVSDSMGSQKSPKESLTDSLHTPVSGTTYA
ncbi:MAG: hypothetical protein RSC73_07465, partial [Ruthenibacterium sp.]